MESGGSLPHSQEFANCPYLEPDQSISCHHPTSWKFFLIFSYLRLAIQSGLFRSGFPSRTSLLSPIHATCPSYLILLDLIIRIVFGEQYESLSYSLCGFPHSPFNSSLLDPNTFLSTLFSNTLSVRFSLGVSDRVAHPYKTKDKIIFLYVLIFILLESKLEYKGSRTEW